MLTFPLPTTITRHLISWWVRRLLGSLLVLLLGPAPAHAQTMPPAPPITVLVRTQTGAPVAGVQLTLRPVSPEQGGPPVSSPPRQATTDAQGAAAFPPLDGAIWYLTLAGSVAGRPLEPPASQGRPPWGTNPAGGGFPLSVDPLLEHAGAAPDPDTAPVLVPLVLVDRGDLWLVGLDLGSATSPPLSLPAAVQPTTTAPGPAPPTDPGTSADAAPAVGAAADLPGPWVAGLPLLLGLTLLGGLALYRRHHPHRPAPAAYLHPAGKEPPHA